MSRELLIKALTVLPYVSLDVITNSMNREIMQTIKDIETELEKPEPKPVLFVDKRKFELSQSNEIPKSQSGILTMLTTHQAFEDDVALYTKPQSQQEQFSNLEPAAWASQNVIPLRGGKDNYPCILTPFKCEANTDRYGSRRRGQHRHIGLMRRIYTLLHQATPADIDRAARHLTEGEQNAH